MKKLILSAVMVAGLAVTSFGQGTINFANYENTDTSTSATTSGLIFDASENLLTVETINAELLGGSASGSLTSLLTITDGNFYYSGVPGAYLDLNGTESVVTGVAKQGIGYFMVRVWLGSDTDWASAVSNGAVRGSSAEFQNSTGGDIPAPTLTGMGAIVLVPEPSSLALVGLAAAFLAIRRRK